MIYYTECLLLKLDQRWCLSTVRPWKCVIALQGSTLKFFQYHFQNSVWKVLISCEWDITAPGQKKNLLVLISSHLTNHAIAKRINNATLHPLTPSSLLLGSAEWGSTCVFCWQIGIQLFDLMLKCWLHRDTERLGVCWIPRTEDTQESVVWGNGPEVCVQVS